MLYYGQFKNVSETTLFEVKIITNNDDTQVTDLTLADDPVHIQTTPDNDLIFTPTQLKSATVKIVLTQPYYDIYSPTKDAVSVMINDITNDKMLFRGFVTPNVYNQGYTKYYDTLEIECVETVSNLKYIDYVPVNGTSCEIVSLKDVIDECMSNSLIDTYHVADSYRMNNSLLDELYIDENNFFDDDVERSPWKLDEVLREVCKFTGLTFYTDEDEGWFVDKELLSNNIENFHTYTVGIDSYSSVTDTPNVIDISISDWSLTGTTLELDDTFNKIKITANTYPLDEELPDIFDSFENQYIVNTTYPNDKKETDPAQHVFVRVAPFTKDNFRCYWYSPAKYLEYMPYTYHSWYPEFSDAITPTVPDSQHRNGEFELTPPYPGDDISDIGCKVIKAANIDFTSAPSSLSFQNQIWFSLGIGFRNSINSSAYGSGIWGNEFFTKSYFPVFVYNADMLIKYQADVRSYILITGSLRDVWSDTTDSAQHDSNNIPYIQYDAYKTNGLKDEKLWDAADHDNTPAHWIKIPYKLKIGNKVYLGTNDNFLGEPLWGSEIQWSGQTYLEVYENSISHNASYQIYSNVIYQSGINESGHSVFISEGVQGHVELILYRPSFTSLAYGSNVYDTVQVPRWVILEDFQIKFIQVDKNYNFLADIDKDQEDTEYMNVINESFVNEQSDIELKINTQNMSKKTSLSSVLYDSSNGQMDFVQDIYSVVHDERKIQENNLVEKMYNHYSTQKRIITGSLSEMSKPDDLYNWREFSNMTMQEQDYSLHYDRNNVKLIEI